MSDTFNESHKTLGFMEFTFYFSGENPSLANEQVNTRISMAIKSCDNNKAVREKMHGWELEKFC